MGMTAIQRETYRVLAEGIERQRLETEAQDKHIGEKVAEYSSNFLHIISGTAPEETQLS